MKKNRRVNIYFIICGFLLIFFYVWIQVVSERLGYSVEGLRKELDNEMEINKNMKIRIEEMTSPERLDRIAKEMNLRINENSQIIEVT